MLFSGFVLSFFLNLTGLGLHQWLGVGMGGLALYHLLVHWKWVKTVTSRFLKCPRKARIYYLLDAGLLMGLGGIVFTGLIISSWLDLPLANYWVWRQIHVLSSIFTLLAVVVKLGLHWKWIVKFAPRPRLRGLTKRSPAPASGGRLVSRREFLAVLGLVGGAGAAAFYNVGQRNFWDAAPEPLAARDAATVTPAPTAFPTATPTAFSTPESPGSVLPTATPTPFSPTATPFVPTATAAPCTVRCPNACAYPGRCRRYTDGNANGLCDLGECL